MCGRFTQNYTWEEDYAFLKVLGTPRNLRQRASLGADALRPAAESPLREWPVFMRVNLAGVGEDDPTIIERVDAA